MQLCQYVATFSGGRAALLLELAAGLGEVHGLLRGDVDPQVLRHLVALLGDIRILLQLLHFLAGLRAADSDISGCAEHQLRGLEHTLVPASIDAPPAIIALACSWYELPSLGGTPSGNLSIQTLSLKISRQALFNDKKLVQTESN